MSSVSPTTVEYGCPMETHPTATTSVECEDASRADAEENTSSSGSGDSECVADKGLKTDVVGPWGRRRLFAKGEEFNFDMTPIINNQAIFNLSTSVRGAVLVVILVLIGTVVQFWALSNLKDSDTWLLVLVFLLGVFVNFIGLFLIFASYSRSHTKWICKSFDFLYLSIQVLIFNTIDAWERTVTLHWGWTLFLLPNSIVTCFCLFGMDASHMPRSMKGALMILGFVVYLGLAMTLILVNSTAGYELEFFVVETNFGSVAQTCALNLAFFCLKFAVDSLVFKEEVILLVYNAARETIQPPEDSSSSSSTVSAPADDTIPPSVVIVTEEGSSITVSEDGGASDCQHSCENSKEDLKIADLQTKIRELEEEIVLKDRELLLFSRRTEDQSTPIVQATCLREPEQRDAKQQDEAVEPPSGQTAPADLAAAAQSDGKDVKASDIPDVKASDIPEGDWALDDESGMYWSDEMAMYFDRPSGYFYDPESEMWYDQEAEQWFE